MGILESNLARTKRAVSITRLGEASELPIMDAQENLAMCLSKLNRPEALQLYREVYDKYASVCGPGDEVVISKATTYGGLLGVFNRFSESRAFLGRQLPVATRALGPDH